MKQIFKFAAVVFAAMLLTNCVKENLEPTYTPVQLGDAIQFGSRAGFASNDADSRTVYTGKTYTYEGVTYEGIDWVINEDMIDIYSPDVDQTGSTNVMYRVTGATAGQESTDTEGNTTDHTRDYATLTPVIAGDAMKWGSNTTHTFYAMYPTAYEFNETVDGNLVTLEQGVKLDKTTMKGIIPSSYTPEVTLQGNNTYVATPNMRYAYMVAKTEHDPSTEANMKAGNKVGLSFVPVVTAVEIELLFPDDQTEQEYYDIYVGQIILSSETQQLSGGFTADLSAWNPSSSATPVCELDETVTSQKYVQISTLMFNSTTGIEEPIKLTKGQSIKVTAFLLPHTNITDLTVGFTSGAATPKEKSLAGAGTIYAKVKTRITKVKLPVTAIPDDPQEPDPGLNDASNWMRDLVERKPNITMNGLSLPGTGGSFSYLSSQDNSYRQQYQLGDKEVFSGNARTEDMDLDKQWELGIRAFEIVSDRPSYSSSATLYSQAIICNKQPVGKSVGSAMEDIIKKVQQYPEETAVVILVYQPIDNDPCRNSNYYAQALANMLTKLEEDFDATDTNPIFKLYTPTMKLSEAAGHVLVMARINQADEGESTGDSNLGNNSLSDASTNWTDAKTAIGTHPVILIDGCGTAKDRWGARGYTLDGTSFANISNEVSGNHTLGPNTNIIESYMQLGSYLYANTGSYNSETGEVTYPTGAVTKTLSYGGLIFGAGAWEETHSVGRPSPSDIDALNFGYTTYTGASSSIFNVWYQEWARVVENETIGDSSTYWFESYYEKLNHALRTFDMAIDNVNTNQIYVNSLCGYLVNAEVNTSSDQPSTGSTYGGAGGDIQGLAKKITPQFYQYVLKRSKDNTTGPTGVVMMDYVSDNPDEGGSHYLPSLIIANNLKSSSN